MRPGPPQKENKVGRTPNAGDWITVPSTPFDAPPWRDLPERLLGDPVHPELVKWWDNLKTMPHCAMWTDSDWDYAYDTAILKQDFYTNPTVSFAAEIRQRENQMGTTLEARRKLGIRYIDPATESGVPLVAVTGLDDRRNRLADAS